MAGCSSLALRHVVVACALLLVATHLLAPAEARYLPTRGQDDRLDRLRELLKDLLEGELERSNPPAAAGQMYDKRVFFKRDVGPANVGPEPREDQLHH